MSKYNIIYSQILFLPTGHQDQVEVTLASLEVIPEPFKSMATTLVDVCAYAGTGNVLKIQHLLHICSEHYETKDQVCHSIGNQLQFHVWWLTATKWFMIDSNRFEIGNKLMRFLEQKLQFCGIIHIISFFHIPVTINYWSIMSNYFWKKN